MSDMVGCPVDACLFEGSISEVADHISESDDQGHTWGTLSYENAAEFCYNAHLEEGRRLQEEAQEARDHGVFDVAIEELEGALHHFQRAKLFVDDASSIENRCGEVLITINEVETAEQAQVVDELVNEAENAIDDGDKAHFDGNTEAAAQAYEKATGAFEEARTLATELTPNRVSKIDRELSRIRVRRQSLNLSASHQTIRDLVAEARDHAAAGDRAFQNSEYETALEEYEEARDRYESLADVLQEFSFDGLTADPAVCDVCRQRFDDNLDSWQIDLGASLQVCPSCAGFGSGGNLPSPRDVATEHRTVVENIESIRDGDVGLTWTSDTPLQSSESDDSNSGSNDRNTQQMLVQLVGLYQQLGKPPTAEDIDEHTDFGFLAYRDEFGSISEALQTAGFAN